MVNKRTFVCGSTYRGISTHWINHHKFPDGSVAQPRQIHWRSFEFDGALESSLEHDYNRNIIEWLTRESASADRMIVLENGRIGSLSTDGKRIFAVDTFSFLRPDPPQRAWLFPRPDRPLTPKLRRLYSANSLRAYDVESGKLIWCKGLDDLFGAPANSLSDGHFLGPATY